MTEKYNFAKDPSARRVREERRAREQSKPDPVQVHIMKIRDLPAPLNLRELQAVMENEGLAQDVDAMGVGLEGARWQHAAAAQRQANLHTNIFATYGEIYSLFKQWHSGLIAQRAVGPAEASQAAGKQAGKAPFLEDIKPLISPEEVQHVLRQQKLVQLLIGFLKAGIDSGGTVAGRTAQPYLPTSDSELTAGGASAWNAGLTLRPGQRDSKEPFAHINLQRLADYDASDGTGGEGEVDYKPPTTIFNLAPAGRSHTHSPPGGKRMSDSGDSQQSRYSGKSIRSSLRRPNMLGLPEPVPISKDVYSTKQTPRGSPMHRKTVIAPVSANRFKVGMKRRQSAKVGEERPTFMGDEILSKEPISRDPESLYQVVSNANARLNMLNPGQIDMDAVSRMNRDGYDVSELKQSKGFESVQTLKLKKLLLERTNELNGVKKELKHVMDKQLQINLKFNKQLNANRMSAEVYSTLRNKVEVKYFDESEGLNMPPAAIALYNSRLQSLQHNFNEQLMLFSLHADEYRQKVEMLEQHGDMKLADFTVDRMVQYIADLEKKKVEQLISLRRLPSSQKSSELNRPKVIWELFKEHFGDEFFLECIEEDFGISPGDDELLGKQITKHFNADLTAYKVEQSTTREHFEKQLSAKNEQLQEKDEEIARLSRADEKNCEEYKEEIRANLHRYYKDKAELLRVSAENEQTSLIKEIKLLCHQRDHQFSSQSTFMKRYAMRRWFMLHTVNKILKSRDENKKGIMDKETQESIRVFIKQEHLILSDKSGKPALVLLKDVQQQSIDTYQDLVNDKQYQYAIASNRADRLHQIVCQQAQVIEAKSLEVSALLAKIPALELCNKALRKTSDNFKLQIERMRMQQLKLESRWKAGAKEPYKLTAKTILDAMELRTMSEHSDFTLENARAVIAMTKVQKKSIGVVTDMMDLRVRIDMMHVQTSQPTRDIDVQTNPGYKSQWVQTKPDFNNLKIGTIGSGKEYNEGCNMKLISKVTQTDKTLLKMDAVESLGFGRTMGRMPGNQPGLARSGTMMPERMNKRKLLTQSSQQMPSDLSVLNSLSSMGAEGDWTSKLSSLKQLKINRGNTIAESKKRGTTSRSKPLVNISECGESKNNTTRATKIQLRSATMASAIGKQNKTKRTKYGGLQSKSSVFVGIKEDNDGSEETSGEIEDLQEQSPGLTSLDAQILGNQNFSSATKLNNGPKKRLNVSRGKSMANLNPKVSFNNASRSNSMATLGVGTTQNKFNRGKSSPSQSPRHSVDTKTGTKKAFNSRMTAGNKLIGGLQVLDRKKVTKRLSNSSKKNIQVNVGLKNSSGSRKVESMLMNNDLIHTASRASSQAQGRDSHYVVSAKKNNEECASNSHRSNDAEIKIEGHHLPSKRSMIPITQGSRRSKSPESSAPSIRMFGNEQVSVSNLDPTPMANRMVHRLEDNEDAIRLQEGLQNVNRGTIGLGTIDDESSKQTITSPNLTKIVRNKSYANQQFIDRGSEFQYFQRTKITEEDSSNPKSKPVHNIDLLEALGQRKSLEIYHESKDYYSQSQSTQFAHLNKASNTSKGKARELQDGSADIYSNTSESIANSKNAFSANRSPRERSYTHVIHSQGRSTQLISSSPPVTRVASIPITPDPEREESLDQVKHTQSNQDVNLLTIQKDPSEILHQATGLTANSKATSGDSVLKQIAQELLSNGLPDYNPEQMQVQVTRITKKRLTQVRENESEIRNSESYMSEQRKSDIRIEDIKSSQSTIKSKLKKEQFETINIHQKMVNQIFDSPSKVDVFGTSPGKRPLKKYSSSTTDVLLPSEKRQPRININITKDKRNSVQEGPRSNASTNTLHKSQGKDTVEINRDSIPLEVTILNTEAQQTSISFSHEQEHPHMQQLDEMEDEDVETPLEHEKRNEAIQQLFYNGFIDEEQFLALQLLEKGYIPQKPGAKEKSSQNQHRMQSARTSALTYRHFVQPDKILFPIRESMRSSLPSTRSRGATHSPRTGRRPPTSTQPKKNNTYNIYPNKIAVLEKIFDRVYAKKSEQSTQCDEYAISQAQFTARTSGTFIPKIDELPKHRILTHSKRRKKLQKKGKYDSMQHAADNSSGFFMTQASNHEYLGVGNPSNPWLPKNHTVKNIEFAKASRQIQSGRKIQSKADTRFIQSLTVQNRNSANPNSGYNQTQTQSQQMMVESDMLPNQQYI